MSSPPKNDAGWPTDRDKYNAVLASTQRLTQGEPMGRAIMMQNALDRTVGDGSLDCQEFALIVERLAVEETGGKQPGSDEHAAAKDKLLLAYHEAGRLVVREQKPGTDPAPSQAPPFPKNGTWQELRAWAQHAEGGGAMGLLAEDAETIRVLHLDANTFLGQSTVDYYPKTVVCDSSARRLCRAARAFTAKTIDVKPSSLIVPVRVKLCNDAELGQFLKAFEAYALAKTGKYHVVIVMKHEDLVAGEVYDLI